MDINGKIVVFKPEAISDYLPKRMSQKTRNWFDRGIKSADSVIGSFSYDGPTHHGTQDTYLMYLIPEFKFGIILFLLISLHFSDQILKLQIFLFFIYL